VGIFLAGLIGWVVYRCMLRKPLIPRDDGALLIGPRYIGIQEPERHHIQGQDNERPTQMKNHLPGAIHASPHFRWPSFNEKPAFHPDRGFHVPDEYLHDDDPLLALPLTTRPSTNVNTRTKPTRTTRTSKSARTFKSKRPTTTTLAGPSLNDVSSPKSDATSLALLELYESDEEEETRRKAREVPWESLRHKSIKRGILEQVKEEEGKWLDSIRGLAGSTILGSRPETIMEECNELLGADDDSMRVDSSHVGKQRQVYSVPDSDPFADSPTRTHGISPRKKRPVTKSRRTDSTTAASVESHGIGFQIIPESAATTPNHDSPRRSFAWLRKADASNALDKLTRLPTLGRKQSPSRSKNNRSTTSSSPVKRTSNNNGVDDVVPRRDILPRSPSQLMSPPLQSQICFTPIPASSSSSRVESQNYSKSRALMSPTKPLVVSSASKSRSTRKKVQQSPPLHNLHRLPKPPLSTNTTDDEALQGRVLQRPGTNHALVGRSKGSAAVQGDTTTMLEDPMKKVERIMASSWSARDLGPGGMRNLSPTGFGRRL
jgi:hypothetical protein